MDIISVIRRITRLSIASLSRPDLLSRFVVSICCLDLLSRFVVSIVVSTTDDLLHVRSKDERVFKLSSITPFDVTERRISLNNSRFDKIVQAEKVFLLTEAVQVPSAKWQSAKVFVDDVKECAC
jgi:hypothetical protein